MIASSAHRALTTLLCLRRCSTPDPMKCEKCYPHYMAAPLAGGVLPPNDVTCGNCKQGQCSYYNGCDDAPECMVSTCSYGTCVTSPMHCDYRGGWAAEGCPCTTNSLSGTCKNGACVPGEEGAGWLLVTDNCLCRNAGAAMQKRGFGGSESGRHLPLNHCLLSAGCCVELKCACLPACQLQLKTAH